MLRLNANSDVNSLSVEIRAEDEANGTTGTVDFADTSEDKFGTGVFGTATFGNKQRRERRIAFRKHGDWFQVKITNAQKAQPMELYRMVLGATTKGYR